MRQHFQHDNMHKQSQLILSRRRSKLFALLSGMGLTLLMLLALLPVGPAGQFIPAALAHAVLLRSDPAANAVLRVPPSHVFLWFDDELVPATSHVAVEDQAGRVVDKHDSRVSSTNPREMIVSVPRLAAGTYTVLWVAQSTDDGHVTEGAFVFHIAEANGTVPSTPPGSAPASGPPTQGNILLSGPVLLQILTTWLALLGLTFWLGGLIWETWILPPGTPRDPALAAASRLAARRFRRFAPYVLGIVLLADLGMVVGQEAELAGSWSGAFAPSLLQAILSGSRFGLFWWLRQVVAFIALALALIIPRFGWSAWRPASPRGANVAPVDTTSQAFPDWWHSVLGTLHRIPRLPEQLATGWRGRSWLGRLELLLGALLLLAFALSGHAAAVAEAEVGYAVSVDVLHLLGNAAWVGGLLYIGFVLVPTLGLLSARQRARVLALGLPQFSALAIISAVVLASTGSLNTSIHLTSLQQFLTTPYGWVLAVKIEFFLLMVAISAYHAFHLRPHLVAALIHRQSDAVSAKEPPVADAGRSKASGKVQTLPHTTDQVEKQDAEEISQQAQDLADRLEDWLRREAMLGMAVLLCVALLDALAGTLTSIPPV